MPQIDGMLRLYGRLSHSVWPIAMVIAAGCSPAPPNVVPVSGRVTLAGEPLAGAVVTFQPALNEPAAESAQEVAGSVGRTNLEGRYQLRLVDPDVPGAVVGKHNVTITTATVEAGNDAAVSTGHRTSRHWRDGSQTYMVPTGGTDRADFEVD